MQSGQAVQTDTEGELDLITVEQAIEMSRGYISNRGSLYNLVYKNVLTRYGTPQPATYDD